MARDDLVHAVVGALIGAGAIVLLYYHDMVTIDPWYVLLLVGGTAGVSFAVGYILSYLTENGIGPSSEDRE